MHRDVTTESVSHNSRSIQHRQHSERRAILIIRMVIIIVVNLSPCRKRALHSLSIRLTINNNMTLHHKSRKHNWRHLLSDTTIRHHRPLPAEIWPHYHRPQRRLINISRPATITINSTRNRAQTRKRNVLKRIRNTRRRSRMRHRTRVRNSRARLLRIRFRHRRPFVVISVSLVCLSVSPTPGVADASGNLTSAA